MTPLQQGTAEFRERTIFRVFQRKRKFWELDLSLLDVRSTRVLCIYRSDFLFDSPYSFSYIYAAHFASDFWHFPF